MVMACVCSGPLISRVPSGRDHRSRLRHDEIPPALLPDGVPEMCHGMTLDENHSAHTEREESG
jgi:hypothetical protein